MGTLGRLGAHSAAPTLGKGFYDAAVLAGMSSVNAGGASWARWRRRFFVVRALQGAARRWAIKRYLERESDRVERLASAKVATDGRLVFVCHGNIMRSAYAAKVARRACPELANRIISGGTHASQGSAAQESAIRVGRELDAPLDDHASAPVEYLALSASDVVVCMDALNEAEVLAQFPQLAHRVFRVGDLERTPATASHGDREVLDPYGQGDEVTRDAFRRLTGLAQMWARQVQKS